MISFGRHICNDYNIAIEKEWLITNKRGSYASSTILLSNTRKYHGLLVAKLNELDNRLVVFPNCDEEVEIAGNIYHISTHQYRKTVYPTGYFYLESFTIKDDIVSLIYLIENIRIKKEIILMKSENTTIITYTLLTPDSFAKIHIRPFIAFREPENIIKEISVYEPEVNKISEEKIQIYAYRNLPPGFIYNPDKGKIKLEGVWYREFFYIRENQAGYECVEDLYNIGKIELDLNYNEPKSIFYSTEDYANIDKNWFFSEYEKQIKETVDICVKVGACINNDDYRSALRQIINSAESFIMEKDGIPYIVSGFHWPQYIWFRDMLAALPGIFLITEKYNEAKKLLKEVLNYEQDGLLPLNMTFNKKEINYTSADTSLWYFYSLYKYLQYTGDFNFIKNEEIFKKLAWIVHKYIEGTRYNIYMDKEDNLIYSAFNDIPLTWMDSKTVNGMPVTPRQGKTIEINALWHNAIRTMQFIAEKIHDKSAVSYKDLADKIQKSFNEKFWNQENGCLFDFFDGNYKNTDVRLNQIFALSLPFELITDNEKKEKIMNVIIKELYTSFGLRSLSNMNVNFRPKCDGDLNARQMAMHQGSVWPWTIGFFVNAYFRVFGRKRDSMQFIQTVYDPIFEHIKTAGLGTVSELFDGSFPYTARGRISHAWTIGEILRSYFEDFIGANDRNK